MRVSFAGSFPKDPDFPDTNEDVFIIRRRAGRLALCDGASESFDSKTWARELAQCFAKSPAITAEWVELAAKNYRATFDLNSLSWSKLAAFERGSFATLLGIELNRKRHCLEIIAIGDSLAILVDDGQMAVSWPYTHAAEFEKRPVLLSTNTDLNAFVEKSGFYARHHIAWELSGRKDPILLCMTDALGEWTLRTIEQGKTSWRKLLKISSTEELREFVIHERTEKNMRTDDSTLIVIRFGEE